MGGLRCIPILIKPSTFVQGAVWMASLCVFWSWSWLRGRDGAGNFQDAVVGGRLGLLEHGAFQKLSQSGRVQNVRICGSHLGVAEDSSLEKGSADVRAQITRRAFFGTLGFGRCAFLVIYGGTSM